MELLLDPAIRDWVLLPIMVFMILMNILRHYLTIIFTKPKSTEWEDVRKTKALMYASKLRTSGDILPISAFNARISHLTESFKDGAYLKLDANGHQVSPSAAANPMAMFSPDNPQGMDLMMEGMKNNLLNVVPQSVIMGLINFFFEGFVLIKLPFNVTRGFRAMLQRGIDSPDLPVHYVSSLSWYFLNLFGLRTIFAMILGESNAADAVKDLQAMSALPSFGGAGAPDLTKAFKAEEEALSIALTHYRWSLENMEEKLLANFRKKTATADLSTQTIAEKKIN